MGSQGVEPQELAFDQNALVLEPLLAIESRE
jgi:hypothetical protein